MPVASSAVHPPRRPIHRITLPRLPYLAGGLACLVSFAAVWAAQRMADVSLIDVMVYRAQGQAVLDGRDLYALRATDADLPATYPPFAALLFVPLALLDASLVRTLATAGNLVLLVVVVHLSLGLVGSPWRLPRPAAALTVSALAVWCEPVWTTLRYGQVNLLLAALVLWDLTRRPGHRWAGAGIGVAAGIKLTPALFAVFLALAGLAYAWRRRKDLRRPWRPRSWHRHLRQAAVATVAFLTVTALGALALPVASHRFFTDVLFRTDRVGNTEDTANQSLHGVLARALHTGEPGAAATATAAAVAALGLAVAVAALLAGPRLPHAPAWAATTCAVTALLVSPVSWSHHWVWCVPAVLLLGAEALRRTERGRWWAAAVWGTVFCSYALWWVPHSPDRSDRLELHQNAGDMLLSAVYPLAGMAFLVTAAAATLRAVRRSGARTGVGQAGRAAEDARAPGTTGPEAAGTGPHAAGGVRDAADLQAVAKE